MASLEALDRYYARLTDEELLELVARDAAGFRPGALERLRTELQRRGLDGEASAATGRFGELETEIGDSKPGMGAGSRPHRTPYAGFLVRLGARVIDQTFLTLVAMPCAIVGLVVVAAADAVTGGSLPGSADERGPGPALLQLALGLAGWTAYFTICEGFGGRTLGKAMVGLVVVRSDLKPAGPMPALKRTLLLFADGLVLGAPAALSMHHSATRQRLGDRSADTVVLRRERLNGAKVGGQPALVITVASIVYGGFVLAATLVSLFG